MFELKVHKPKDKQVWIRAIRWDWSSSANRSEQTGRTECHDWLMCGFLFRSAVQTCQEDEDDAIVLSSEERQRLLEAKRAQIRQIVGKWRRSKVLRSYRIVLHIS
jgi:A-kinase anchor protein 13